MKGCLLLQYGAVEEDEAEEGFRPWIHRDLKPQNVFLDDRQRTADFSMYPQGRIGDFGLAICTDEQDPDNPFAYLDAGTPYWTPPELILLHDGRTMLPIKGPKLGEKTNVWGIGAIMSRLISREPRPNRPAFEDAMPDGPGISGDAYKYSQELRDTIKLCCNYRPGQRVSLRELREEILKYTVAEPYGKVDRAEGMRSGRPEDVDEAFMLPDVEPTYTIGFQVEPEEQCQPQ